MTVSSETRKAGPFSGDDITTVFPFAFRVFSETDVLVVISDANGVETELVKDSDYTVTLNADQSADPGGDITTAEAIPSGSGLVISSAIPMTQEAVIPGAGNFSPTILNTVNDKQTILIQQLAEKVERSVKVPITSTDSPDDLIQTVIASTAAAEAAAAAAAESASGALHGLDVRWYGGISNGTSAQNATALSATASAALASGVRRVYIPFDSWTVTDGTDVSGCILVGNGDTALTGAVGYSRAEDIRINGVNQGYTSIHPVIPFDRVPKLITKRDANTMWAIVEKPTTGYAYLILKNNVTTAGSDSLATTTSDATQFRVTQVYDAVECLSAYLTASSSNGAWSASTLTTGVPTYDSGTNFDYQYSSTIGAWYEMTVTVPLDGFLSVGFVESASSSNDATITVDGVAVDSNFTLVSATTRRVIRTYTVKPGVRVVKITNNTAGSTRINLLGCYFARLKDQRNDVALDTFGVYRLSTNINPLDSNSANDYVIKDYNSAVSGTPGIYGGSYHGGESSISTKIFIDGVDTTVSIGNVFVGRSIELQQSCTITWSGAKAGCTYSGDSVTVYTRMDMLTGGYAWQSTVTGAITVKEVYATLFGVNEDFTAITAPQYKTLSSITDGAFYPVGQHNAVEYHYAATGQRLRITHSLHTCPDSKNGGSYLWRVVGSYVKYYSPWVWRGKRAITSITGLNIVQAS